MHGLQHDETRASFLTFILSLGHASWYATPENEWSELFSHYVPDWLAVKDKTALRGFYEGDSSIYRTENINVWLKPLALWSIFTVVLIFIFLCVTVLVRKQWTEREKLSYPIIQLPLAMTRNGTGNALFSNKLFLLGFGLMAVITMINALHFHFPAVPNLRLRTDISSLFTEKTVERHRMGCTGCGLSVDCGTRVFYTAGFVFLRLVFLSVRQSATHHNRCGWVAPCCLVSPISINKRPADGLGSFSLHYG